MFVCWGVLHESVAPFFCILLKNLTKNIWWIEKIVVLLWCEKGDN
jgi:hypothetical protein